MCCKLVNPTTFLCSWIFALFMGFLLASVLTLNNGKNSLSVEMSVYENYVKTSDLVTIYNYSDPQKDYTIYYYSNISCTFNNEYATRVPPCFEMMKNKSLAVNSNSCSYPMCVQYNSYMPSHICSTDSCWVPQQQRDCVNQMRQVKCNISYSCRTTYICDRYPFSAIDICNKSCPGLQCTDYSSQAYYPTKCNMYQNLICPIFKQYQIHYVIDYKYQANETFFQMTSEEKHIICYVYDYICQKNAQRIELRSVYYDKFNPKIWTRNISTSASPGTIAQLFFGAFFTVMSLSFLIKNMYDTNCCVSVNNYHLAEEQSGTRICAICYDKLNLRKIKKLGCRHVFHEDCIDTAQEHSPNCPTCRTPV